LQLLTARAARRLTLAGSIAILASSFVACRSESVPFTRESVLEEYRTTHPDIRLPESEPPGTVRRNEDLTYSTAGGTPLKLDLYSPPRPGPHPVVLMVHGGGWERGDRFMERPFAKHLAARGYATATVSHRLHEAGRFPAPLHDLKAAVRWLRENARRYDLDPTRVAAVGASSGGQLVALLGASNTVERLEGAESPTSSAVQAVVDIDGLADFTGPALLEKERKDPGAPTRFLGGPYEARRTVWREASAITHVGPQSAPTLFVNSTAERPILPGRPEMCAQLRTLDIHCEIIVVESTPHPFWLVEPWFSPTVDHVDRFLRSHLVSRSR
jgi:acetyl esterase/lipase